MPEATLDIVERQGRYHIAGFVGTEEDRGFTYRGYRMLGVDSDLPAFFARGIRHAFISLGYLGRGRTRDALAARLGTIGFRMPVLIDPTAVVASDATLGGGTLVGKGVVVNAAATVGRCVILNTGAVVDMASRPM